MQAFLPVLSTRSAGPAAAASPAEARNFAHFIAQGGFRRRLLAYIGKPAQRQAAAILPAQIVLAHSPMPAQSW